MDSSFHPTRPSRTPRASLDLNTGGGRQHDRGLLSILADTTRNGTSPTDTDDGAPSPTTYTTSPGGDGQQNIFAIHDTSRPSAYVPSRYITEDAFFNKLFYNSYAEVDDFIIPDICDTGGASLRSAQRTTTSPAHEDRHQNFPSYHDQQRTGNVAPLSATINQEFPGLETETSFIGTSERHQDYSFQTSSGKESSISMYGPGSDAGMNSNVPPPEIPAPSLKLYHEEEKPGHDPPYYFTESVGPAGSVSPSSATANIMPGIHQIMSDISLQYSNTTTQTRPHVPVFRLEDLMHNSDIMIVGRDQPQPQYIPLIQKPSEELQLVFLSFLMQNAHSILSFVTSPDEASMAPIRTAFEKDLLQRGLAPPQAEIRELFSHFRPVIGTVAGRQERNNKKVNDTKVTCPFTFCQSPFTRKGGLKNHLSAHFALAPRPCLRCGKALPISSHRRHEGNCKGPRAKLSGPQGLKFPLDKFFRLS
ncbi:hypothetical protein BDN70DRAFT_887853 [Pholiota conissans]|uniref:C2H2-type domain-containing protein n=1 Tax=Pholiota conissans TaxID=109636 RepID=A0A9P5YPM8_9AGAR|nr:hypothetical protein BDN70DRAFT_887853 [Pholiota conissans]